MKNQTGMFARYALDSSFFIDLFTRDGSHPRDRYIGMWERFEGQVEKGEVVAPLEIREELTNSLDAELDRWLVEHRAIFVEVSRPQLDILKTIVLKYPAFTRGKENMADPAVVALAAAEGLKVLTSERRQQYPSPRLPKIPNLCDEHQVPCLGINDYLRAENIVLRLSVAWIAVRNRSRSSRRCGCAASGLHEPTSPATARSSCRRRRTVGGVAALDDGSLLHHHGLVGQSFPTRREAVAAYALAAHLGGTE